MVAVSVAIEAQWRWCAEVGMRRNGSADMAASKGRLNWMVRWMRLEL